MSVILYYSDLRLKPSVLVRHERTWHSGLTAHELLREALGAEVAHNVALDLASDNHALTVSWYNRDTDAISEIGGVGTLDWRVMDSVVITVAYEDTLASQEQLDELERWLEEHEANDFGT